MSRELWLLRHGKSDREIAASDINRPLKKRGKRAAQQMGAWMKERKLIPDRVLTSPAERARETALRVCEKLGVNEKDIHQDIRLYASSVGLLRRVLAECPPEFERVLLVAHNPELEQILIELVGATHLPYKKKLMPTAALARIAMPEDWTQLESQCAQLIAITYPKSLFDEN